jgi:predicted ABC-class ATPase
VALVLGNGPQESYTESTVGAEKKKKKKKIPSSTIFLASTTLQQNNPPTLNGPRSTHTSQKDQIQNYTLRRRNKLYSAIRYCINPSKVAVDEGVLMTHVHGIVRHFESQDQGVSRPCRGLPSKLTERDRRAILREVTKDPFI